jgi:hypothetical protein
MIQENDKGLILNDIIFQKLEFNPLTRRRSNSPHSALIQRLNPNRLPFS